jgi:hypothetical protein
LSAQLIEFVPWTTFGRPVERYFGNHRVRTLTCSEQCRAIAFARLTYRESLRDIEACLSAQAANFVIGVFVGRSPETGKTALSPAAYSPESDIESRRLN